MNSAATILQGTIVTFYSYKGGCGRTMAVANYACHLAQQASLSSKRLLLIDWDLEAPGLHRFFDDKTRAATPPGPKGLIEYFCDLQEALEREAGLYKTLTGPQGVTQLERLLPLHDYIIDNIFTGAANVDIMLAGRFGPTFIDQVASFDWIDFFEAYGALFFTFRELLASRYAYTVIDSRTGLTDTSGICTMLMPDKLVAVFTPNLQSLDGTIDLLTRSLEYRSASSDLRSLTIFPLPSRIENVQQLQQDWRDRYQGAFEQMFRSPDSVEQIDLTDYFNRVLLPHKSDYAFGERIALTEEKYSESGSLRKAYETFFGILDNYDVPWHRPETLIAHVDQGPSTQTVLLIHGNGAYTWRRRVDPILEPHFKILTLTYSGYDAALVFLGSLLVVLAVGLPLAALTMARLGMIDWRVVAAAAVVSITGTLLASSSRRRLTRRAKLTVEMEMSAGAQRPHVIAVGFGTYLLGRLLTLWEHATLGHVILVDSVLPRDFPWRRVIQAVRGVRNELVPQNAFSKLRQLRTALAPGLGTSGLYGFRETTDGFVWTGDAWSDGQEQSPAREGAPTVQNVLFKTAGHSEGFMGATHIVSFWLPFFWGIAPSEYRDFIFLSLQWMETDKTSSSQRRDAIEQALGGRVWSWTDNLTLRMYVEQAIIAGFTDRRRRLMPAELSEMVSKAVRYVPQTLMERKESQGKENGRSHSSGRNPRTAVSTAVRLVLGEAHRPS